MAIQGHNLAYYIGKPWSVPINYPVTGIQETNSLFCIKPKFAGYHSIKIQSHRTSFVAIQKQPCIVPGKNLRHNGPALRWLVHPGDIGGVSHRRNPSSTLDRRLRGVVIFYFRSAHAEPAVCSNTNPKNPGKTGPVITPVERGTSLISTWFATLFVLLLVAVFWGVILTGAAYCQR